jgi:sugar lactone lactonase YvrE
MEVLIEGPFELAEGARLIGGRLHFVDLLQGRLYAWDQAGLHEVIASSEPVGVAAPVAGRHDVLALAEGLSLTVAALPAGGGARALRVQLEGGSDPAAMRVNDGCCDAMGRFWIGTMPVTRDGPDGCLCYVDSSGAAATVLRGIGCPNGPAFGDDNRMYLADTLNQVILSAELNPETGECGPFGAFATVPSGLPDGMAVDREGCLWVAVWGAAEILRFSPDGRLRERFGCGAAQPTSVCLMPVQGRQAAVVTTARTGLAQPGSLDGAVLALETDATAPPAAAWEPGTLLAPSPDAAQAREARR